MADIQILAAMVGTSGLLLDILGVIFLALFTDVFSRYILRTRSQIGPDVDQTQVNRIARSSRWTTYIGLGLIIGGFSMQAISIWIPIWWPF